MRVGRDDLTRDCTPFVLFVAVDMTLCEDAQTLARSKLGARSNRIEVDAWRRSLVGAHFGVIEALEQVPLEPDDLPLAVFAGRLCRTSAWAGIEAPRSVSGAAMDETDALAACIGEAVERYSAALVPPLTVVHKRIDELEGRALSPEQFALFSRRQYRRSRLRFPFEPWNPRQQLTWTEARSIPGDERVWVPAVFVYQPFRPAMGEPSLAPSLSTGLACGRDAISATIAALCEVIERDAVALAWLGRIRPPRIDLSGQTDDYQLEELVHELNSRGFHWSVFDLTTDLGVPVVAALIEGESSLDSIVSFGSACHPNRVRATEKALVEAAHCRMYIKSLWREQPRWSVGRKLEQVTTFADHARFYTSHPRYRRELDRWWKSSRVIPWDQLCRQTSDCECNLPAILSRISAAGYEAYRAKLTTPDLEPLGFHAVRTLIPGLQPLHGNHAWPHLGGNRLKRLRDVFGPGSRQPWRFNPFPHPCP